MLLLFWKIQNKRSISQNKRVFSKIREAFLKIREAFPNIILLNTKQNLRKSGPEEGQKEDFKITLLRLRIDLARHYYVRLSVCPSDFCFFLLTTYLFITFP